MAKEKVIVIDMKETIRRHLKKDARFDLSKCVRDQGVNIYRCIAANMDRTAVKLFGINPEEETNKTVVDIWFPDYDPNRKEISEFECKRKLTDVVNVLKKKNFNVLKSTIYIDPDDQNKLIGKILIDLVVPEAVIKPGVNSKSNPDNQKNVVTNQK